MEDFKRRLFLAADYAGDRDPDLRPRHPLVFRAASDMRIGIRLLCQLRLGNFQVDASGKRQHRRKRPAVHVAWNYTRSSVFRPALRLDQEMVGHFQNAPFGCLIGVQPMSAQANHSKCPSPFGNVGGTTMRITSPTLTERSMKRFGRASRLSSVKT